MKIALLSAFYPFRGGIAQFGACLFRELEKDHEVKAYTFTRQYPDFLFPGQTQLVTDEDNADTIPSIRVLDTINPFTYRTTAKAINEFNPDVLVVRLWMSFFGPSMGTVARMMKNGTKVIAIVDNAIPHEPRAIDKPFTKFLLKHVDGYIVMTESVKNDLLLLNPKSKHITTIEHPFYDHFGEKLPLEQARQSLKLDPSKKTILFFGFIRDYKGLDILLEAFAKLDDTFQLVIAGESYGSFDRYQQLIDQNANSQNIHVFSKYISDSEVTQYFSAADVCVLPYRSATQSGIASISYHFNVPMIVTDVGGLKESVYHEENGLLVESPEPQLIAQSINRYFDDGLGESFKRKISELKEQRSWKSFADRMVKFCEDVLQKK